MSKKPAAVSAFTHDELRNMQLALRNDARLSRELRDQIDLALADFRINLLNGAKSSPLGAPPKESGYLTAWIIDRILTMNPGMSKKAAAVKACHPTKATLKDVNTALRNYRKYKALPR